MRTKYYAWAIWVIFTPLLLASRVAQAQVDKDLVEQGDITYEAGAKLLALEQYQEALKINPDNVRANFMVGKSMIETVEKGRAGQYFIKAYALDPNVSGDVLFLIGQSLQYGREFDQAVDYYNQYKTKLSEGAAKKGGKPDSKTIAKIEEKIFQCENGKKLASDPLAYDIVNLSESVNSPEADYAPTVNRDETLLIFTSRRPGGTGIGNVDKDLEFFEDIYVSEFKDGKWQPAQNIGTNINTENHDASVNLSADGTHLFLYRDDTGTGDIFVCEKQKNGTWSSPVMMNGNINSAANESSASVSIDGKALFFSSDRPGGKGGIDLYVSKLDNRGRWGIAQNLGAPINTKYDEEGAFIDYDGKTLYFSSRGHQGTGGYDIFMTEYDSTAQQWKEPVNIGYPVNTPDDDIYFTKSGASKFGYYASVKDGGLGDKDIYRVAIPEAAKDYPTLRNRSPAAPPVAKVATNAPQPPVLPTPGKPAEAAPKLPRQPITLTLHLTDDRGTTDARVAVVSKTGGDAVTVTRVDQGVYQCVFPPTKARTFVVSVEKEGYMFRNDPVVVPLATTEPQSLRRDIRLDKLEVGFRTVLRNIYFHTGQATFQPDSYAELRKLEKVMKQNPGYQVEISGHTDQVGNNQQNQRLSQRRAEAVVNYLTQKGINAGRMTAKGYGEDKPLATNDDEKEGRAINRRTEFEVTGEQEVSKK
ncbi:MAG: OmpA family protein [Ferruginibacter sp.]|nr:OmpA family protein [Cytophagales bacterium]